jgi:hypothetical protein
MKKPTMNKLLWRLVFAMAVASDSRREKKKKKLLVGVDKKI